MKKCIFILSIMVLPFLTYSQNDGLVPGSGSQNFNQYDGPLAGDLDCPPGTVYSHSNVLDATLRASGTFYNSVGFHSYDRYEGTEDISVNQIVVWGTDIGNNYMNRTFIVEVYQEVGGKPITLISTTGTSTLVETTPFISGSFNLNKFTLTLNTPITLHPGEWICPYAIDGLDFYWNYATGGDNFQWGYNDETLDWFSAEYDFALCLVSTADIPVSDWALGLGILLILGFTVIRFVKNS